MNPGYFPKPDTGIEARAAWAMPSTGFGENLDDDWDEVRTPDHPSVYDERAAAFYDQAIAKLKEYGLGDFSNPFRMTNEFERALIMGNDLGSMPEGAGNRAMVETVRAVGPKNHQMGTPLNIIPLRDAWRAKLDQILVEQRKAHPDIPDPTTFDTGIAQESAATRAHAADVRSRATFMGKVGGFVGGTAGTVTRTDQLIMTALTLPVGGVAVSLARTLVGRLLVAAATNAALGAAQTGATELTESRFQQQHFGYSKSGGEIARDMGYAAAASALLGTAFHAAGEGGAYLLSRWKSGSTGPSFTPDTGVGDGAPEVPGPGPGSGPSGEGPSAFGLRAATEQAQELYPVLPKIGRDAADVLDSELQVATTGPANDLDAHAANVAEAVTAVTQGKTPAVPNPTKTSSPAETTPGGHQIQTHQELVEADELTPSAPPAEEQQTVPEAWRPGDPWPDDVIEAQQREREIPSTFGINTPEREQLRAEIADELYRAGAAAKEREAVIVLGPPAAGKSTIADPLARNLKALIIDSDMAKVKLPEYGDGTGATAVHEESDAIARAVFQRAVLNGDNVIVPILGKTLDNVRLRIQLLRKAGYRVRLVLADLPIEKAVNRAITRFRTDGRFVDPQFVWDVGDRPIKTYESLKMEADSYARYSTDVPQGEPPRLIEEGGQGDKGSAAEADDLRGSGDLD